MLASASVAVVASAFADSVIVRTPRHPANVVVGPGVDRRAVVADCGQLTPIGIGSAAASSRGAASPTRSVSADTPAYNSLDQVPLTTAPWHPDPAPAVHPKQWRPVVMRRRANCPRSIDRMSCSGPGLPLSSARPRSSI